MPTLQCPACDARFTPDPDDRRRRVPCPDCGEPVRVSGGNRARGGSGVGWGVGVLIAVVVLGLGCCGGVGGLFWYMVRPTEFDEPTQDYADARKAFKTTLTTQGKTPQKWQVETPPAGVKEIDYTSGDLKLKAWVDEPQKGDPAKPAVLFLHGGFAFGAEDWDQCKPFRDAGFVTLVPRFRGENGLPGNFTLFYDEVDDCLAAAEVLAKLPGVDPNRLYVAGHSAGGTLAMLSAMTSKRFKACASFSGSPDQVTFVRDTPGVAPFDTDNRQELAMRSPLAYYQSFKCPARLYYGDDEGPITELATKKLAQKATASGKDVRAVEVAGDHMTAVDPAIRQAVTFFQQTR